MPHASVCIEPHHADGGGPDRASRVRGFHVSVGFMCPRVSCVRGFHAGWFEVGALVRQRSVLGVNPLRESRHWLSDSYPRSRHPPPSNASDDPEAA